MIRFLIIFLFCATANGQMIIDSYRYAVSCTADPNEMATTANATSDPNCNEANATTGWTGLRVSQASQSTTVNAGTYALQVTADVSNSTSFVYLSFSVTNTQTYDVTFDYYVQTGDGTNMSIAPTNVSNGFVGSLTTGGWQTYTRTVTATTTGTCQYRILVDDTATAAGDGDVLIIDNFSFIAN